MAATVSASAISSAMQSAFASLAVRADTAQDVTIAEMCDVVANAVAAEVNATIVASYTAHAHGVNAVPATLVTTATVGTGSVGVLSGTTDTTDTA